MAEKKQSYIENLQLTIFTICYTLSCILLYWGLSYSFVFLNFLFVFLVSVAFFITAILIWAHLYVIFSIPHRIARKFDPVKNDISAGIIQTISGFRSRLSSFLVSFYNYSFFDVEYSAVKTKGSVPVFSDISIDSSFVWDNIEAQLMEKDRQLNHGKICIKGIPYYASTTPVYFGSEYLGFFTVYTKRKQSRLMFHLLRDFENNFLDDQLKIVMGMPEK